MNQTYLDTARLLMQVAPLVFVDDTFALKGGTAINLFVRDMPRLSVDLDLVFPDHKLPRDEALTRINEAVRQAAERLKKRGFQTHAPAAAAGETKLLVRRDAIQVKVEVNFVMRGTVQPVRRASVTPTARDILLADLDIPVVSLEDVYGRCVAHYARTHGARTNGAFCCRWLPAHRSGRCWVSRTSNTCRASAGSCRTWCSCRKPMRRGLPSKQIRSSHGWGREIPQT
ncbi:MAG: nucleotidyl transferase AbiEii/AbiGii toxin family protein [Luteibacter jiangsuensis]